MSQSRYALIFDCYTVEPAGLGVPPFLSSYVRYAFAALRASGNFQSVYYATIDDFRAATGAGNTERVRLGHSDPLTYSQTANNSRVLSLLADADLVVVIAGDAVPSVHLHAQNGSTEEIVQVMTYVNGSCVLLGPAAQYMRNPSHTAHGFFEAFHRHPFAGKDVFSATSSLIPYAELDVALGNFEQLLSQIPWQVVAEIELYRGCTRRKFCSFCDLAANHPTVEYRPPADIIKEVGLLYDAGVRHFRLGQQACFFSYYDRSEEQIVRLLCGIRERCPDIAVLHIDNVDPLAAGSSKGRAIAKRVVEFCTEGNCAPMGVESFDPEVVAKNNLTATPEVVMRAIANLEEFGSELGPLGQRRLLPGLNLVYGLPGETAGTHAENLRWLSKILDEGHYCHRTNVRQVAVYENTPLISLRLPDPSVSVGNFVRIKAEIAEMYDLPMKQRVYPVGTVLHGLHAFFVNQEGTWFRRLGSYPIMVVEQGSQRRRYEEASLVVTSHAGRYIYGRVM